MIILWWKVDRESNFQYIHHDIYNQEPETLQFLNHKQILGFKKKEDKCQKSHAV